MTREQLKPEIDRRRLARAFARLVEAFACLTALFILMAGAAVAAGLTSTSAVVAYVLGFAAWVAAAIGLARAYDALLVVDPGLRQLASSDNQMHMVELHRLDDDSSAPEPAGFWFGVASDPRDAMVRAYLAVADTEDVTVFTGAVYAGPETYGRVPPEECRRNGIHRSVIRPHAGRKACAYCSNV